MINSAPKQEWRAVSKNTALNLVVTIQESTDHNAKFMR